MNRRVSNAATRRQIERQARHLRRGRRGPCPFFVEDRSDPEGGRIELGEEVSTLFHCLMPGGFGLVVPLEHHVSRLTTDFTWRDVQRSRLYRGDTRFDPYVEALLAAQRAPHEAALAEAKDEARGDLERMDRGAVSVAMGGYGHDAVNLAC